LTGNVSITFPTSFSKSYDIQNLCTGSSGFDITLGTTAAGGQVIAVPFGETVECFNDGANIKFKNLGRVGSYMDVANSGVPNWIAKCTVPPYLNCNGAAFSATTYPALAVILGGTTLPDMRGTSRATLNQGTARITAASGINGDVRFSVGGNQLAQAHQHTGTTGTDFPDHTHNYQTNTFASNLFGGGAFGGYTNAAGFVTGGANARHQHSFTTDSALGGGSQNMPPTTISGITLIRAG
jgi:hypothetical protein